jgi:hypothetical protein
VHSILWVTLFGGFIALLGFLVCILPGIWLYVSFAVAVPVLLTEGLKGRHALRRSFSLVKGRWWSVFAIIVLGALLTGIVDAVVGELLAATTLTSDNDVVSVISGTVGNTISTTLTTPFSAAFVAVLYFDLRVRKEGFDLQLLAERLGLAPKPEGGYRPPPEAQMPSQPTGPSAGGEQPPFWPPPPGWKPTPREDGDE